MSRRRTTASPNAQAATQPGEHADWREAPHQRVRIDVWLWRARFASSRTLAAQFVAGGNVRISGRRCETAARLVGAGNVLTLTLPSGVRVILIIAIGTRRGPVPEARALYTDVGTSTLDRPNA